MWWDIVLNVLLFVMVAIALYQECDDDMQASSIAWMVAMVFIWFKVDLSILNTLLLVIPYLVVGVLVALVRWAAYCRGYTARVLKNGTVRSMSDTAITYNSNTLLPHDELVQRILENLNPKNHQPRLVGMVLNWPIGLVATLIRSVVSLARWCVNGWSFSMFRYMASSQVKRTAKPVTSNKGDNE